MDPLDELRTEVEELRASRARIVHAADAERRQIERDLHDGAQQHLVALAIRLQLARQLVESDLPAALELLNEIAGDVHEALAGIRDLAHRIYPPLLLDRGLPDALRAAATALAIPVSVEVATLVRYSSEVEAAVYFACLDALRNAERHAGRGARVTTRVWPEPDVLRFEVSDDGRGFEPGISWGAGLHLIADRIAALDGELTVSSEPGRGTSVSGRLPLDP